MYRVLLIAVVGVAVGAGCTAGNTRDGRAAFDDGFTAFQAGQWQRAVDGFTRYLRADPQSPSRGEVYYYRGEALVHLERRQEAMVDFQRSVAANPPEPILTYARLAMGNLYYEESNDAKAVEMYAEVVRHPSDELPVPMLLLRLGVSLQRLGRWQTADKYLGHLIQQYPKSPAAVEAQRRYRADSFAVQTGAFASLSAAQQQIERLRAAGFQPRLGSVKSGGRFLHTVRVGNARNYAEAQELVGRVTGAGFQAMIVP